jgi:hypothetical protein
VVARAGGERRVECGECRWQIRVDAIAHFADRHEGLRLVRLQARCGLRGGICLLPGQQLAVLATEPVKTAECHRQPRLRKRELRIGGDGLLIQLGRLAQRTVVLVLVSLPAQELGTQEQFVGSRIFGRLARNGSRLGRRQRGLQRGGHGPGDFLFDREDVFELAVVALGPQVRIGFCLDQLQVDQHLVADALHTPFEQRGDAEFDAHGFQIVRMAGVFFGRGARDDLQVADLRQVGQDQVLHAGNEVGVVFVLRQVLERQHGDRLDARRRRWGGGRRGFGLRRRWWRRNFVALDAPKRTSAECQQ